MLIAQMVARNESERFLRPVLERLAPMVDHIIFTDDASLDDTAEIAIEYGADVQKLDEPLFTTNEGLLRGLAWNHLCEVARPGDWVLAIDADEMLYAPNLDQWLDQTTWDVLGITFYHMWNPIEYRTDKAWAPNVSSRLFRFYDGGQFPQRKLASGSEPEYVQELIRQNRAQWNTGFRMKHLGYVRDEDKGAKYKRYMEIDGGDFHSRAHLESILDPMPTLVPWVD